MKKAIIITVVGIVVLSILGVLITIIGNRSFIWKQNYGKKQFETALEQNNFAKAKELCKTKDLPDEYLKRAVSAEIDYLVSDGDFDFANQIATEQNLPNVYYDKIVPNLITIYTKHGAAKTILALSSCVLPTEGEPWGGELWERFNKEECKIHYAKHNEYIARLMEYMKLSGDNESIAKVSIFLAKNYEGGTKDVNAIKVKFGL